MAGNYTSPITSRVVDVPYECAFPVGRRVARPATVSMSCESEAGTGTLIGFSEYTSPSTPPKKYRKQSIGGSAWGCPLRSSVCNPADSGGGPYYYYTGSWTYDRLTGALTNTALRNNTSVPDHATCGSIGTFVSSDVISLPWDGESIVCAGNVIPVAAPTVKVWNGTHCDVGGAGLCGNTNLNKSLSEEDTDVDAMERASSTTLGVLCTAEHESRGAGDFTFGFVAVAYTLSFNNLIPGETYIATVSLVQENYGGGGSVTITTKEFTFDAVTSTHSIVTPIDCPAGKQVTVQDPIVNIV